MSFYITIGRQNGCGGRIVGKELAAKLGVDYYDKDVVIDLIAEDCGLARESVSEFMEKRTSSLLYEMATFAQPNPLEEQIFISKTRIVNQLADKGSCVFVGICADYILRDRDNVLKVFLYGSAEERLKRVNEVYGQKDITSAKLKTLDKHRGDYYKFFTSVKWGDRENYDININTDLGIDQVVAMIELIAKEKLGGVNIG